MIYIPYDTVTHTLSNFPVDRGFTLKGILALT